MARQINVADAGKWDEEELAYNLEYLRDRNRDAEVEEILAQLKGKKLAAAEEALSDEEEVEAEEATPKGKSSK
jgi:hypothetical protein